MKVKRWILPVLLMMLVLTVMLLPFSLSFAYAGRSEEANHILTYDDHALLWNQDTVVDVSGSAKLNIFEKQYPNVKSENDEKIIAPGTQNTNIIRLKNNEDYDIDYTAVFYYISEEETLPLYPEVISDNSVSLSDYALPEHVEKNHVIKAVQGTVSGHQIQDFDISWSWQYLEDKKQDLLDTDLGNKAAFDTADQAEIGVYFVVEADDMTISAKPVETGDDRRFLPYIILMTASIIAIASHIYCHRKKTECPEQ